MREKFAILWWSVLIAFLAMMAVGTSATAGSILQGPGANRQFTLYPLAYVDPGSGQLIWQMVAAACVGGLFYVKRVRDFLGRLVKKWFRKP